MDKRLLMVIVFGLLACESASGQGSGAPSDATRPMNLAASGPRTATSFQLKGVLISKLERTALVNSQLVQAGDRVGGVEILAIDQEGVRVLMGAQQLIVNVGGTFVGNQSSNDVARTSRSGARRRHTVKHGETLSGIALRYRRDDVTVNQMMIALFQSNPQAFSANINVLHAGAVLRIPDDNELHEHAPQIATAEVTRHKNAWQAASRPRIRIVDALSEKRYGPVKRGETLSGIAARVLHDDSTMNQMMIALFQSNPQAFGNNINVLLEGAILHMPDENQLRRRTPETATAEVARHTKEWQRDYAQHSLLTLPHTNMMASSDEPMN